MGGSGSGRWHGRRPTTEECLTLDLYQLKQAGLLRPGARVSATITWDPYSLSVALDLGNSTPLLTVANDAAVDQFRLVSTIPHFGGRRWWLHCHCGRRCRALHSPLGRRFRCRTCVGLSYASQHESRYWRLNRHLNRRLRRMGGSEDALRALDWPDKPKGMHWSTFQRLQDEWVQINDGMRAEALPGLRKAADRFRRIVEQRFAQHST